MLKQRAGCLIAGGLVLLGAILVVAGFTYDILFAGIPPQDPPPDIAANYIFHARIASQTMRAGLLVLLVGLVAAVVSSVIFLVRKAAR